MGDRSRPTPPQRPSAMDTPPSGTDLPDSWKPTLKPGPRPSAPAQSPQPNAAEIVSKADRIEKLMRPGFEVTNNGDLANNGYVKRKARLYAVVVGTVMLGVGHFVDRTLPIVYDLYEKHLDRQAERELAAKAVHP